jgi:hypothetical protein
LQINCGVSEADAYSGGGMTTTWCWKTFTRIITTTKSKWLNSSSMVSRN